MDPCRCGTACWRPFCPYVHANGDVVIHDGDGGPVLVEKVQIILQVHISEQNADIPVPQIHEELVDSAQIIPQERIWCMFEEFDDLAQIAMNIPEVVETIPQECIAERILEQIVDAPVPQNLGRITVPGSQIQEGFAEVNRPISQDRTSMLHVELAESSGEVGSSWSGPVPPLLQS